MDRKAALATAAGLVLVVAGAASALASAWTQPGHVAAATAAAVSPTIVTEYVDQFGNPVAPPSQVQADNVIITRSPLGDAVVVSATPTPGFIDTTAPVVAPVAAATSTGEHDDEGESESGEG
jgi:hypothetical protein